MARSQLHGFEQRATCQRSREHSEEPHLEDLAWQAPTTMTGSRSVEQPSPAQQDTHLAMAAAKESSPPMTLPPPGKSARSGLASLSLAASLRAAFCSSIASLQSHTSQLSPSVVISSLRAVLMSPHQVRDSLEGMITCDALDVALAASAGWTLQPSCESHYGTTLRWESRVDCLWQVCCWLQYPGWPLSMPVGTLIRVGHVLPLRALSCGLQPHSASAKVLCPFSIAFPGPRLPCTTKNVV